MAQMYNSNHSLRVPLDGRLWLIMFWTVAAVLLAIDSLDGRFGIIGAWGLLFAAAGSAWATLVLHAYSRRIVLDVMSFEHRQQTPEMTQVEQLLSPRL